MSAKADGAAVMTKDFRVSSKLGFHARPVAAFVKTASRFTCDIFVEKSGVRVSGKSVISLLLLAAGPGSELTILARGEDATQALAELEWLIENRFGEE